jgi:membrane-associated phospholipid phosphatase
MRFASFISSFTEPMILISLVMLLGGWHAGLRGLGWLYYVVYLLIVSIVLWIARIYAVKILRTNWDISDRAKRVQSLIPLIGICIGFLLGLLLWDNQGLIRFGSMLLLWLVGFSLITLKTKISGHMAVLTFSVGLLLYWYGLVALPLMALLPMVGWSRLVLKRHTMIEVIGGTLYSTIFLFLLSLVVNTFIV